ncbi:MAG: rhodanese-like domain-containing protein [Gammaproteobacteria bacterium]|nr:rhodanese-like domain-containing protein [Gammaproteobacteria bacterium]
MNKLKQHFMLRIAGILIVAITLSGCFEPPPYNNLDNQQLDSMLQQKTQIFDIRRPEEWRETGVIANSKLLTFVDAGGRVLPDFLPRFTSAVGKDDKVILICRTGNRTDVLARHLVEKMGYSQVYNVQYGITDWLRDGKPVTRPRFN